MTQKNPKRITRFFRFVLFRFVPLLLILGIVWFGVSVVQAVSRRVNEQIASGQRAQLYQLTLTAVYPTLTTFTPTPVDSAFGSLTSKSAGYARVLAQAFETNTPRPPEITLPAMNTAAPIQPTPEVAATATLPADLINVTAPPLPTVFFPEDADPNIVAPTAIPTRVPLIDRQGYDLVNILLLGVDNEITGDNVQRTDTMIVVSINRTTNTISMLSLPRDLYVFIPGWTMQRLNLAYFHGESVGWTDGGFGLMRQTILYNFGINVHYYALINLSGFKQIIDTLGGVDVAVDCAIQDYPLVEAPPPPEATRDQDNLYTLPVGYYHFDGGSALWYARSRHTSIEFDRGRRQQQILRAIWRTALAKGLLTQLPQLWSELTGVVKTDLKFEDMLGLLPYALNLDPDRIEHFTMARLYHTTPWQPPDGAFVQLPNYDPIHELMEDFYQPPTESQVIVQGARIEVYNGSANANWDRVAADSLGWAGFTAIASGQADNTNYTDSILIDYSGQSKGSSTAQIAELLNIKPENVRVEPDPNRTADYKIILGSGYTACTSNAILPVEETTGG